MKNIANRLIVIAAGALALGTMAFGQTNRIVAEIPFAFRTVAGVQPAGTYQIDKRSTVAGSYSVILRNTATGKATFAGNATVDSYHTAAEAPQVVFACADGNCSLQAIRTLDGSLVYNTPSKVKGVETALIAVPLKTVSTD